MTYYINVRINVFGESYQKTLPLIQLVFITSKIFISRRIDELLVELHKQDRQWGKRRSVTLISYKSWLPILKTLIYHVQILRILWLKTNT